MSLENAINYRLFLNVYSSSHIANKYGYNKGSYAYKILKEDFEKKYSNLFTLEEFTDEIILSWMVESENKIKNKKTMAQIIGNEKNYEENRHLFNKTCKKVKSQNEEELLTGIPTKILENKDVLNNAITCVDETFYNILESAKNNKLDFKPKYNDILSVDLSLSIIEYFKNEYQLEVLEGEDSLDTDFFFEKLLKVYDKKIDDLKMEPKFYTKKIELEINKQFNASINTIPYKNNFRRRTKKTIFDKMQESNLAGMNRKNFLEGYKELVELYYKRDLEADNLSIDDIINFYNIESKYNLIFYSRVVKDLIDVNNSDKEKVVEQILKLAVSDMYIYRSSNMENVINRLMYLEKSKNETFNHIYDIVVGLMTLKNTIVNSLLEIQSLNFEELKFEAFEMISFEAKEEIVKRVNGIDLLDYLDIEKNNKGIDKLKNKLLNNLKSLMQGNKEVLLERSKLKNIKGI
ncbi:hypothetical protein [Clostridium perfringens]|uniref:hypothetical protein n=1 Tax=Clostridium perfringens TaxID=1502 RepID=UPI0022E197A0|nr:hypothetical protein [Clostridium perfringens]